MNTWPCGPIGTTQMYLWLDRPAAGWTTRYGSREDGMPEYRRILLEGGGVRVVPGWDFHGIRQPTRS